MSKKHELELISPAWLGKHFTLAEIDDLLLRRPESKVFLAARVIAHKHVERRAKAQQERDERIARVSQSAQRKAAREAARAQKSGEFELLMSDLQETKVELERLSVEYSKAPWGLRRDMMRMVSAARQDNDRAKAAWAEFCSRPRPAKGA
jgi:hypothetical protein